MLSAAHTQTQIGSLDNQSADVLRVGTVHDCDHLHRRDFERRVSPLAVLRCAVDLDELAEVAAVVQRRTDGSRYPLAFTEDALHRLEKCIPASSGWMVVGYVDSTDNSVASAALARERLEHYQKR